MPFSLPKAYLSTADLSTYLPLCLSVHRQPVSLSSYSFVSAFRRPVHLYIPFCLSTAYRSTANLSTFRSVRVAERLALPTSDHGVAGSNPAGT